jgi:hypothetical protein
MTPAPVVGEWAHIVFSVNSSDVLKGYWNGVLQTTDATATGSMTDTNRQVSIGARINGTMDFTGAINHVAIWNTQLSDDAVKDIYNRGAPHLVDLTKNVGSNYTAAANLQHWWRLGYDMSDLGKDYGNGTAIDVDTNSVGIDNTNITPTVPGGASIDFDGNTQGSAPVEYVFDDTGRTVGVGASYSMACWFMNHNASSANNEIICDIQDKTTSNFNRILIYDRSTSAITAFVSDGSGNSAIADSGIAVRAGEWHHAVLVKNGTTSLKLYLNGEEVAEDTTSVPTTTDASNRSMAWGSNAQDPTATQAFDGAVAESALWSSALSAAEVRTLFNGGNPYCLDLEQDFRDYASSANLVEWQVAMDPARTGETGGNIVRTRVGSFDLELNDSGITHADDHLHRGPNGTQIELDGSADRLEDRTDAAVGIANAWTICFWVSPNNAATAFETVFDARPDASNLSIIQIGLAGTRVGDTLACALADSAGTTFKNYRWDAATSAADTWSFYTVTWNGTSLRGYKDAVEDASPVLLTDTTGTMADDNRMITLGDSELNTTPADVRIALCAAWDEVISDTEIQQVFNMGLGASLTSDYNAYASSANLIHQWRPGAFNESANWGKDLSDDADARDLTATSIGSARREPIQFEHANSYD